MWMNHEESQRICNNWQELFGKNCEASQESRSLLIRRNLGSGKTLSIPLWHHRLSFYLILSPCSAAIVHCVQYLASSDSSVDAAIKLLGPASQWLSVSECFVICFHFGFYLLFLVYAAHSLKSVTFPSGAVS